MSEFVEMKTAELTGEPLNWAVAKAVGHQPLLMPMGRVDYAVGVTTADAEGKVTGFACRYSSDWSQGGPLIEKYKVLLTPPTDMVHRNFGYMDERNGYYESGHWGSTIFGKVRKHRRAAFHHPDSPLIAAMRAIAQFELGDTVSVPKELLP